MREGGDLAAALDALAELSANADRLPVDVVAAQVAALDVAAARMAAAQLRLLRSLDRRIAASPLPDDSAVAFLRRTCRYSSSQAGGLVGLARSLDALPHTTRALTEGAISPAHARVIASAARDLPPEEVREAEPALVERARRSDARRTSLVARQWRHVVDENQARQDASELHRRRFLNVTPTLGGLVRVEGMVEGDAGEAVLTALHCLAAPRGQDDDRTAAQRRADALSELATWALAAGLPGDGSARQPRDASPGGPVPRDGDGAAGARPQVTVTIDLAALLGAEHSAGGTLAWNGHTSAEVARLLACDASVTRIVLDPASQPLDVGRSTRTIPPGLRKAVVLRDQHCTWPGCDRPPPWCDVHHRRHWAQGGSTSLDNLHLLCRRHHRQVHEFGAAPPPG